MRYLALGALLVGALSTAPLAAQDCAAEIDALFDGALDPWQRPPHRVERLILNAAGVVEFTWDDVIETPLNAITTMRGSGQSTLILDRDYWIGPSPDGPWTRQEVQLPGNRIADSKRAQAERRAGVSDPHCDGLVEVDGQQVLRYSFRTETPPDAEGKFFGDSSVFYVDPISGLLARWDVSEIVAPWKPVADGTSQIARLSYDPSIALVAPGD